jgi:hypothetical protein
MDENLYKSCLGCSVALVVLGLIFWGFGNGQRHHGSGSRAKEAASAERYPVPAGNPPGAGPVGGQASYSPQQQAYQQQTAQRVQLARRIKALQDAFHQCLPNGTRAQAIQGELSALWQQSAGLYQQEDPQFATECLQLSRQCQLDQQRLALKARIDGLQVEYHQYVRAAQSASDDVHAAGRYGMGGSQYNESVAAGQAYNETVAQSSGRMEAIRQELVSCYNQLAALYQQDAPQLAGQFTRLAQDTAAGRLP